MLQFIIYFLLTVISAVALWWFYFTSTRFYKLCNKIPGPTVLPVIGNVEVLINRRMFIKNLMNIFQKHPPISKIFLGSMCIVGLVDADDIHKLLHSNNAVSKFGFFAPIKLVIGENMLTAERDNWKKYRQIWNPAFRNQVIKNFIPVFNGKSKILIRILKQKNGVLEFDMFDTLVMLTMDILLEAVSGINFKIQENEKFELCAAIKRGRELIQEMIISPIYWFETVFNNSKYSEKVSQILKIDRQFLEPILNKYSKRMKTGENNDSEGVVQRGMIDYVFEFSNREEKVIEFDILNDIRLLEVAGSETTAFTVSVCLMLLGLHKDVQDKVTEELRDIFCDDINRPAEFEDLQKMVYTEQVIKETMRLFPIIYATGRRVNEDIEIGGYVLPAGTDVVIPAYLIHRNPIYYPDPLKFDPERFTPENIRSRNPHCFIPFLTGPRNCIGHYYAMLQMKTVLSHLLRHYDILPCGSREEMEDYDPQTLLSLKHGYKVRMKLKQAH